MSIFAKHMKENMAPKSEDEGMGMTVVTETKPEDKGDVDHIDGVKDDSVFVPSQPTEETVFSETSKEETYETEREQSGYEQEADPEVIVDDDTGEVEIEDDEEGDDLLDGIDSDEMEIDQLQTQMNQLMGASAAIESFGINPTAVGIMKATGLLSGTALETIALESFGVDKPHGAESQMALEALGEKLKETSAKWSAKIISVVKDAGGKVLNVLTAIWNKIIETTKKLGSAVKETVTAHPYATAVTVVGAIAAVAGVIAYAGGNLPMPGAKPEMFKSFTAHIKSLIDKIKWPFGKINAEVVGEKLKVVMENVKSTSAGVKEAASKALGWTPIAVKAVTQHLTRAWDAIKIALTALGARGAKIASGMKDFAIRSGKSYVEFEKKTSDASHAATIEALDRHGAGAAVTGIMASFAVTTITCLMIYRLVKWVVVGGLKLILSTMKKLIGGSKPEEATA